MKYTCVSNFQLFILAIMIAVISAGLTVLYSQYESLKLLPLVEVTATGECVKVTNYENGHAFGCPDKDVLLRRYRTVVTKATAALPAGAASEAQ
jgi:hypothetical protein